MIQGGYQRPDFRGVCAHWSSELQSNDVAKWLHLETAVSFTVSEARNVAGRSAIKLNPYEVNRRLFRGSFEIQELRLFHRVKEERSNECCRPKHADYRITRDVNRSLMSTPRKLATISEYRLGLLLRSPQILFLDA